jgi:hypothetical protein
MWEGCWYFSDRTFFETRQGQKFLDFFLSLGYSLSRKSLCHVREVIKPRRNIREKGFFQIAVCCPITRDLPEATQRGPLIEELAVRPSTHGRVERLKEKGTE